MTNVDQTTLPTKLSDQEVIRAILSLQTKVDALGAQMFNSSCLLEFMIEKMNSFSTKGEQGDEFPIYCDITEFQTYVTDRAKELQAEYDRAMTEKIKEVAASSSIDLNE